MITADKEAGLPDHSGLHSRKIFVALISAGKAVFGSLLHSKLYSEKTKHAHAMTVAAGLH